MDVYFYWSYLNQSNGNVAYGWDNKVLKNSNIFHIEICAFTRIKGQTVHTQCSN